MANVIVAYFRGKSWANICKVVIESFGNLHQTSLCLIIYNDLIKDFTVFVSVDYLLNDCPNLPYVVFIFYNLTLIKFLFFIFQNRC